MEKEILFSIVMPTYNRAHLLPRAINSIINQTYTNWELIIVDDGSNDDTENVLREYLIDPRIKYVQKENTGAGHSRNVGVTNSVGQYLTFLDSDDEAYSNWLMAYKKLLDIQSYELICNAVDFYNDESDLLGSSKPSYELIFYPEIKCKFLGGGFLISKKLFENIGGYDRELASGQHTELALRIIPQLNMEIQNIEESLIRVHIHTGDKIRGSHSAKYNGAKRLLTKYQAEFNKVPGDKSAYQMILAYNASKLGLKREAFKYAFASFVTSPSFKNFLLVFKYSLF